MVFGDARARNSIIIVPNFNLTFSEWIMIYKHSCWNNETKLHLYEHKQETLIDRVDETLKKYKDKRYTTITPKPRIG